MSFIFMRVSLHQPIACLRPSLAIEPAAGSRCFTRSYTIMSCNQQVAGLKPDGLTPSIQRGHGKDVTPGLPAGQASEFSDPGQELDLQLAFRQFHLHDPTRPD